MDFLDVAPHLVLELQVDALDVRGHVVSPGSAVVALGALLVLDLVVDSLDVSVQVADGLGGEIAFGAFVGLDHLLGLQFLPWDLFIEMFVVLVVQPFCAEMTF